MNLDGEIIDKIQLYLKIKNYLRVVENELVALLEEKLINESEESENDN